MKKCIAIIVSSLALSLAPFAQTNALSSTTPIAQAQISSVNETSISKQNSASVNGETRELNDGDKMTLVDLGLFSIIGLIVLVIAWKISRPIAKVLTFIMRLQGQKCPTCGRKIHNSDQCPYCGYIFQTGIPFLQRIIALLIVLAIFGMLAMEIAKK